MKKLLCFLLCLTLIFSSVSLSFATDISWNTTDSGHLTEIRNSLMSGGTIYNLINACNTNLNNINYNLVTLMGWLDPSTGGSTTAILNKILSVISYTDAAGALKSWLADIWQADSLSASDLNDLRSYYYSGNYLGNHPNFNTITNRWEWLPTTLYPLPYTMTDFFNDVRYLLFESSNYFANTLTNNYADTQTYTNPLTLQTVTFNPTSTINGLYTWLSKIQYPVARLSYVLASDERIAAQEAAAANEEAIIDNFIDSTGDGAASPSDIGSMSNLSSGYKQNFGSDASPSGIFDIFNSDHATWFSQETKNQLDTTTPTRLTKGSQSETPLLDKQIEDIYDALGVKQP